MEAGTTLLELFKKTFMGMFLPKLQTPGWPEGQTPTSKAVVCTGCHLVATSAFIVEHSSGGVTTSLQR